MLLEEFYTFLCALNFSRNSQFYEIQNLDSDLDYMFHEDNIYTT